MASFRSAADHDLPSDDEDDDGYGDNSSDSGDEPSEILQSHPRPNAVYNSIAIHEKLEEIGWPEDLDWLHSLSVTFDTDDAEIDVNDDLAREMAFYTQALEGTREAFMKLQSLAIPFLRPVDYYAEMVKSDVHMLKVKESLLSQQKQMEEIEERRKARESKRFSKEVQAEKIKERAKEKKESIESVKKWRKMRQDKGFEGEEDAFPVDFDDGDGKARKSAFNKRKRNDSEGRGNGNFDANNRSPKRQFGASVRGKGREFGDGKLETNSKNPTKSSFRDSGRGNGKEFNKGKLDSNSRSPNKRSVGASGRENGRSFEKDGGGMKRSNSNAAPWDRSGGKGKKTVGKGSKVSKNRKARDAKYGHGGRKSMKKANTAESSAGFFGSKGSKGKRKQY